MSTCPICSKPVDALRARNVKVRGIQVVAYCSPECLAQAGDSTATVVPTRPQTPATGVVAKGVVPDSGPVIEIRYEPASGVVTSAKDERTSTPIVKDEPKPKPKPKPIVEDEPEPEVEAKKDKRSKKQERRDRKASDRRPILKVVDEPGGVPRDIKAPTPMPVAIKEPEKLSVAKLAQQDPALAPGTRRATRETLKRDSSNVDQAEDWLDDEPANDATVRSGTAVEGGPKVGAKRALLILLALAVIAAVVILAIKFLGSSNAAKVPTKLGGDGSGSVPRIEFDAGAPVVKIVDAPVETPPVEDARTRAVNTLRHWLEAKDSPRIQRLAAAALSRTKDQQAIERLARALQGDNLEDAGRHEVAYALARAGDKRGLAAMTAALNAPRRDDKLFVGRLLVQLGDTRAIGALAPYLGLPQHRLGAAEWLARLNEARAIKALEQIRADDKASADDKARAVIALVHSGKTGLDAELHALLEDPRFNVFAAEILAIKHDAAARPVLVKQLEVTSLRVGAARALRALEPQRDYAAEVKLLLAALADPNKQRDTEQVSIAEAILLLVGPVEWAERQ